MYEGSVTVSACIISRSIVESWFLQPQEISRNILSFASKLPHSHAAMQFSAAQVSASPLLTHSLHRIIRGIVTWKQFPNY